MPKQGDIVLIPIPFTDLSSQKRRPVIVISNDAYNRSGADVVVVALTSSLSSGPYSFTISSAELALGNLQRPSTVRVDKVYTLAKSLIVKEFGRVKPQVLTEIQTRLADLAGQRP
jgi:mRNA interferase MazF